MENKERKKETLIRELQAKTILLNSYNDKYPKIVKIEEQGKPDLFDSIFNVGVEVTFSTKEKLQEKIGQYKNPKSLKKANEEDKPKRKFKNGLFLDYRKEKFVLGAFWQDFNDLLKDFKEKLSILNKTHYKCNYNSYDLYIKAEMVGMDEDEVPTLLREMSLAQENQQYKYRYVYIQFLPFIYCFDLQNNICERKKLTKEFCTNLDTLVKKEYDLL